MNFDSYRTIAEISVALTGFIGIVVVLQHKDKSFSRLGLTTILALPVALICQTAFSHTRWQQKRWTGAASDTRKRARVKRSARLLSEGTALPK